MFEGQINELTIGRLACLGAQGNKASGTYAEWRERPSKKSVDHCKPDLGSGKDPSLPHHRSHYGGAQGSVFESVHMVKYSHLPRDHEELTGMDGCPRDFRKVCMTNWKTRL